MGARCRGVAWAHAAGVLHERTLLRCCMGARCQGVAWAHAAEVWHGCVLLGCGTGAAFSGCRGSNPIHGTHR
eukprot:366035-Chlamydomonas_euryale.AAC.5